MISMVTTSNPIDSVPE